MHELGLRGLMFALALVPSGSRAASTPAQAPASTAPASTAPASTAPASATTPPVQRPIGAPSTAPTTATPAPTLTSAPLAPADTADATPSPPAAETSAPVGGDPGGVLVPEPAQPAAPGLAEQLLGPSVNQHPSTRPTATVPTEAESAAEEDEAIAAMYRGLYRPGSNPGRFNVVVRAAYAVAGSVDNTVSGRLGLLSADLGQSFNKFGYALTLVAQVGSLDRVADGQRTQTVALLGGGPTLSLGRLALLQRGFLDLRVGYDFLVGPTRRVTDGVAQSDGVRAPHGPRLALNMGLMSNPARPRRLFHGFGLSIGYQALLGSFRGDLPVTNVLQFGVVYWGG